MDSNENTIKYYIKYLLENSSHSKEIDGLNKINE